MGNERLNLAKQKQQAHEKKYTKLPVPDYVEDTREVVLRELKKRGISAHLYARMMDYHGVCSYNTIETWLMGRRPNVSVHIIDIAKSYLDLRLESKKRSKKR